MTELTFVKRVAKSGRGYLIWSPKDIVDFSGIDQDSVVEIKLNKLEKQENGKK